MSGERVQVGIIEEDIEAIIGNLDPDLGEFLQKVDTETLRYESKGRLVSGALPSILHGLIEIRSASIDEIRNSTRIFGVIEPKIGKYKSGYSYDREDILAFSAVCWHINTSFRENGSFDEAWVDIVEGTKDLLGGENVVSSRLNIPQEPDARFSTWPTSYEEFTRGFRYRGSSRGGAPIRGKEPRELTTREVAEEFSRWDEEKFKDLHSRIPDSFDSIDSVPMMREVPTSIVEKVMFIYDLNQGNNPELRRVKEDPVSAALLKKAIRDYLSLARFLQQIGEPYDIAGVEGALMRLRHA